MSSFHFPSGGNAVCERSKTQVHMLRTKEDRAYISDAELIDERLGQPPTHFGPSLDIACLDQMAHSLKYGA